MGLVHNPFHRLTPRAVHSSRLSFSNGAPDVSLLWLRHLLHDNSFQDDTQIILLCFGHLFTRKYCFRWPEMETCENCLQSGIFLKHTTHQIRLIHCISILRQRNVNWFLLLTCLLSSAAELWYLCGILQSYCASVFHQCKKEQSGASGGGPGSHGQFCKSHF